MPRVRQEKIRGIEYTYYPQGPDGPAHREPGMSGFTSDDAATTWYQSEVHRHTLLYLAEQAEGPVPDHPSAYLVELSGLSARPYRMSTNIPAEAVGYRLAHPSDVITYQVHSIRTAKGRILREKGTSRRVADATASALITYLPSSGEDDPTAPWAGTYAPGFHEATQGPSSHWPRRTST